MTSVTIKVDVYKRQIYYIINITRYFENLNYSITIAVHLLMDRLAPMWYEYAGQ